MDPMDYEIKPLPKILWKGYLNLQLYKNTSFCHGNPNYPPQSLPWNLKMMEKPTGTLLLQGLIFGCHLDNFRGVSRSKHDPQQGIRNKALCELSTPMSNLHPEAGIITYPEDLCTVIMNF